MKYILLVAVVFAVIIFSKYDTPKPVDWSYTLSNEDKIPYGTYILFNELKKTNGDNKITVKEISPYEYIDRSEEMMNGKSTLLIIQSGGFVDDAEWKKITEYVERGNNVFLSAYVFDRDMLEKYHLRHYYVDKETKADTLHSFGLANPSLKSEKKYSLQFTDRIYYFGLDEFERYYNDEDDWETLRREITDVKITGFSQDSLPDFVEITKGKGKIYLHANPRAFTNFSMIKDDNAEYALKALSYIPQGPIIWDEHYKKHLKEEGRAQADPLSYILEQKAFSWSFSVLVIGVGLFFLFRAKRMQRAVPVVKPLANTSLEFTETVGRLYFNRGDHKDILIKKIMHFLQFVYSKYQLRFSEDDPAYVKNLTEKSGVPEKDVKYLVWKIKETRAKSLVMPEDVMALSTKIDEFYTKAK